MKKVFVSLLLILCLLCGCIPLPSSTPTGTETGSAETIQGPASSAVDPETGSTGAGSVSTGPAAEVPESEARLSFAQAFRSGKAPAGSFGEHEIAFQRRNESGELTVDVVSREALLEEINAPMSFPRTHCFDQFLSPGIAEELLPVLDYAILHNYSTFSIPSAVLEGGYVNTDSIFLSYIYNYTSGSRGFSGLTVTTTDGAEGPVNWVLVHADPVSDEQYDRFLQGLEAARAIVKACPDGLTEVERALYLYSYLTEHVTYYTLYYETTDWSLLYDALVNGSTVCAGYAEALCVLYNFAGIDCMILTGYLNFDYEIWHAWNGAKLDGKWYLFDSTWDTGESPEDYRFFAISSETMNSYCTREIYQNYKVYGPSFPEDLEWR